MYVKITAMSIKHKEKNMVEQNMVETKKEFVVYKRRWVVLISFVCVNAVMQYVWATFSSIATDAWKFYGFEDAASGEAGISMLTVIIMLGMITLSIPASALFAKIGWYKSVAIAGVVLACFAFLRGFIGGTYSGLILCTIGCAITQPFIINAFGMIAAYWFPPKERGVANGWGMVSTYIGVVMAQFGVPWLMTTFNMDIPQILKVYGFLAIPLILFFLVAAKEKPPTPPCDETLIERVDFKAGMKALFRNKRFINALIVFWIMQGIYFSLTTLFEPILQFLNSNSLNSMFIGTLGTIITVTGTIATLVLPIMSDHSKSKKRLPMVRVCQVGALAGLVLVIFGQGVGLLITAACLIGVFLTGITPVLMVFGYETAYPVSEGITESLMQLGANGIGFIYLLFINGVFRGNHMGTMIFFAAGMVVCVIMMAFSKEASLKDRLLEK